MRAYLCGLMLVAGTLGLSHVSEAFDLSSVYVVDEKEFKRNAIAGMTMLTFELHDNDACTNVVHTDDVALKM